MTPTADARTDPSTLAGPWAAVLPVTSLLGAQLIALQPAAGLAAVSTAAFVPCLVMTYWTVQHPGSLSLISVFAAGLILDCVTSGPIGFLALVYVAAFELARVLRPFASGGLWRHALVLVVILAAVVGLQGLMVALTHLEWPSFMGSGLAAFSAVFVYPVVGVILEALRALGVLAKVEPS